MPQLLTIPGAGAHRPTRPPTRARSVGRRTGLVPVAFAFSMLLAACAGPAATPGVVSLVDPSATPDGSAAPSASSDPQAQALAFAECMREHGVDMVDPQFSGDGGISIGIGPKDGAEPVDRETLDAAQEACEGLMPRMGGDPNATMDPEIQDRMLAYSQCMRDQGIDFPDPVFEGGGAMIQLGGPDGGGPDPNSEAFKAAEEACADIMPAPEGGEGGTSSETRP